MTRWFHLFPSRTQQLSTVVAKVSAPAGRIARCRAFFFYRLFFRRAFFFSFIKNSFYVSENRRLNIFLRMSYAYGIINTRNFQLRNFMSTDSSTPYGNIQITTQAIASVVARTVLECYGVVGLTGKDPGSKLCDGDYSRGIQIHEEKIGYSISVYVCLFHGVKITEIANQIQNKLTYVLEKTFSIPFKKVGVYVNDLKDIEA